MNEFDQAAARVAGPVADPLDRAAAEVVGDQRTALRSSLYNSLLADPEVAARATKLGRQAGLPADVVERNLPEVQRNVQLNEFDQVLKNSPTVAQWLTDQNNAKIAHDDVGNLDALVKQYGEIKPIERTFLQEFTEPVQRGLAQGRRGLTLLFNELGIFQGLQRQRDAARIANGLPPEGNTEIAVRLANQQREIERFPVPEGIARGMREISEAQTFGDALSAALSNPRAVGEVTLQSLGASAPALVAAAAGSTAGPWGTAAGAGLGSFAVEYGNTLQDVMGEKGVNARDPMALSSALDNPEIMAAAREKAIKRGIPIAIFDALTAGLAGKLLAGAKPSALSVGSRAAGELGLQAGGGAAGEATAQAVTGEYKPGDILLEALAELPTAIVEVPANYRDAFQRAQVAEQRAQALQKFDDLAKASKVRARDADTFEAFVAQATEDGPVQDVYIDANTLMQSGNAEAIAATSPAVAEQLPAALATGGDIKIPIAEYTARIAGTEYSQGLLDHLKTEPGGMSRVEAQEFMQSQAQILEEEVQRTLAEKQGDQVFKDSAEIVKAEVKRQLTLSGRFTEQVNDAYASLWSARYATLAAQLGTTPEELFNRGPLQVLAESVAGGQQFDQAGNLKTDTPEFRNWFGESKVVDDGGAPLVLYHGAKTGDITEFGTEGGKGKTFGTGLFLSSDATVANTYTPRREGGSIYPVYASLKNPLVVDFAGRNWNQGDNEAVIEFADGTQDVLLEYFGAGQDETVSTDDVARLARKRGHDGVIIRNVVDNGAHDVPERDGPTDLYVAFEPTQIKSVFNRGTFDSTDANILNQFAGQKAETADMYALVNAQERLAKGEPAERVRKETGWFQGVDGVWRFEIADNEAKFNAQAVVTPEQVSAEIGDGIKVGRDPGSNDLFKATFREGTMQYKGAFGRTEAEAEINLLRAIAKERNKGLFDIAKVTAGDEFFLSDVLDHPKLFAAYPDLADVLVRFVEGVDYGGVYNPRGDRIGINVGKGKSDDLLSILLHEIQHAIQQREGFARGGAPDDTFSTAVKAALRQLAEGEKNTVNAWKWNNKDKLDAAEQAAQVARYGLMWESAQRLIDYANRDKPSGVFRLIRNEMQWIYGEEFRSNETARDLQSAFYGIPRSGTKRNQYLGDMSFRAARLLLDTIPAELQQQFKDDPRTMKGMVTALRRESEKKRKALAPLNKLERTVRNAENVKEAHRYSTPFEIYQALAGEIEARNTQARQRMTEDERLASPPSQTADVPAERTIVMFGGLDIQAPMAAFSQDAATLKQGKGGARGTFNPATNTIALLKNADLSTFLHESGHFFLETQFDVASRLEGMRRDGASLSPGEEQILADTSALLKWFGVRDLPEWYGMDFEVKREYHERFARGFEAYLFEGKAPSIELQGLFQRFRAWLLNVYRELKALNVELTDEVRAVFDRMLATTEQIQLAEQGRSMMPLFTSAEQAGMTVEEFAAYQALGVDATNEAIQDVQARTLRDLAWTRNARGREVKRLQKQAAELRAEVQMEVRREVMSQPVYRAWQFLTGKLSTEDKAAMAPVEIPKSGKTLDPSQDSIFVAIAKLGGLDRKAVESAWGWDPKERSPQPSFGTYLLRREGGLSLDAMGERLQDYGYLTPDENGKFDPAELEEKFQAEYRGDLQYSMAVNPALFGEEGRPGEGVTTENMGAGRFDLLALKSLGLPEEIVQIIQDLKMTAKDGIHPDIVADLFSFTSGDELVRTLAIAQSPKVEIEGLTDARMLERYGDLATPEAIERAADKAIHNEARARFVATEVNALAKATGQRKILTSAARDFARAMIARLKVRDIRPGQYASAEVRAAKAAEKASKSGDLATAAAEKRNQLVNNYATRSAYDAQEEIDKGVRYLNKFDNEGTRKGLDADYLDQIDALRERFDFRKGQSLKTIDKRKALAEWIQAQRDQGLEPEIPAGLENEAFRKSYKDLTVEEFRGLVDTVRQIEHLGRLKNRLLTAADNRAFEAVKNEIVASVEENAGGRIADTRTPTTNLGRALQGLKNFYASHVKAATWARILDGGKDGGPMWEYLVRSANERGNMETTMRAEATVELSKILAPVFKLGKMGGSGQFFPTIGRSLNREARLTIALNTGNQGNLQRLLGGEGWSVQQIQPVLESLTAAEWQAVQAVWNHFESYRPQIGAKERRVYGKEPAWIEPQPFTVKTADGDELTLAGGYYPIKYDPAASQRAEEYADAEGAKRQLQGAFTSATTRRSFTKTRSEEVSGRPLLYTLAGLYGGVNDVIHDLAWHEWLIDANRLLRNKAIDGAIRNTYGPEVKNQFKTWVADIAEGEKGAQNAAEQALGRLRQGVSAAGLGFNVMSAAMQVTGFNQSIVRVGAKWVGRGIAQYIADPVGKAREVVGLSEFMADRSRTQFRELNELRNRVQDESATMRNIKLGTYFMMMRMQRMVDVPTWLGAYEKAIAGGNNEERAVALADQAVIDSQGSGMVKDLSAVERGGPALKLFTVFYSYMNTALNLGVGQTMTAKSKAKLAADYLMLFTVPVVLGTVLKEALTPGGGDDDDDLEKLARKLAAEQLSYLMGLMVVVREFNEVAKVVTGAEGAGRSYGGPAGLRAIGDAYRFAQQAGQGEFDDAFRKAAINLLGDFTGLPAAQINRTITGTQALAEGQTENPAAVLFGYQK